MKKIVLALIFSCSIGLLNAQDFHLSQYDAAALNANPGMTGVFKGDYRIHGHYRNQWMAVATKPFTTGIIAFDVNKGKWGYGGQIANFRAGTGSYNVISIMPSFAYKFALDKKKTHVISLGAQVGFFQKSIKVSALTFGDQYSPYNGGQFANPTQESLSDQSTMNLDANVGFMYYYGKPTSQINPFGGATMYHVNRPSESFKGDTQNKLPFRYEGILGARCVISPTISLMPKVFYQYQETASELTYTLIGQFYLKDYDLFLFGGPTFRNKDAAIIEIGAKYMNFIGRFSYDINTSSLSNASNGRGGSEMSLTYIFNRPNPNPVPTCPKL